MASRGQAGEFGNCVSQRETGTGKGGVHGFGCDGCGCAVEVAGVLASHSISLLILETGEVEYSVAASWTTIR